MSPLSERECDNANVEEFDDNEKMNRKNFGSFIRSKQLSKYNKDNQSDEENDGQQIDLGQVEAKFNHSKSGDSLEFDDMIQIEKPQVAASNVANKGVLDPKSDDLFKFSHTTRTGDGSDPFRRYQFSFNQYQNAIMHMIDENGQSRWDINIHAVNCCFETYLKNTTVILHLLESLKDVLKNNRQEFFNNLKKGNFPSFTEFKNMTFQNGVLVSLAKQLTVQVIQFQTLQVFLYGAITSDHNLMMFKPESSKEF